MKIHDSINVRILVNSGFFFFIPAKSCFAEARGKALFKSGKVKGDEMIEDT